MYTEKLLFANKIYFSNVLDLIKLLRNNNIKSWLVGGCVRDLLLSKEPHDLDFCFNCPMDNFIKCISKVSRYSIIETGIKHGTVTIYDSITRESYEFTILRGETAYSDHRHPDTIAFTESLEDDLKRRDFTINSFAYDLLDEELYMLDKNYKHDLGLGIIRCVGDPVQRFNEDALRMLRAIRFAAQLGFSIDKDTFKAIIQCHDDLKFISKERIRDELTKILLSDNPQSLEYLSLTGLDKYTLPISKLKNCKQHNKYHYTDVMHHTYDVIKQVKKDFILRWAALFHDFGKPDCVIVGEDGFDHYYGHAQVSAQQALTFMQEFKFDTKSMGAIYSLVENHDAVLDNINYATFKKLVNKIGFELFPKFLELRQADVLAHVLLINSNSDVPAVLVLSRAKNFWKKLLESKDALSIKDLAVNGYDLIDLGFSGSQIGIVLKTCLKHVIDYPKDNKKEYLINFIKQLHIKYN